MCASASLLKIRKLDLDLNSIRIIHDSAFELVRNYIENPYSGNSVFYMIFIMSFNLNLPHHQELEPGSAFPVSTNGVSEAVLKTDHANKRPGLQMPGKEPRRVEPSLASIEKGHPVSAVL